MNTPYFFLYLLLFLATGSTLQSQELPNILVIIADDAGWGDFGFHGSKINTPTIDSLAEKGMQLDRFYVNPTCSPTRASFLTGRPASRMGIVAPISDKSKLTLPDSIVTLPQLLKANNYETALFGKWHLGLQPENGPEKYGFGYSYGFLHGQIDQYTHKYKNGDKSWHRNGTFIEEEGHTTDLITKEAIKWLNDIRNPSKNFFMQIAYSAPHFPLQEEDKWKKPYNDVFENQSRIDYAASLTHMDSAIGILLKELKEKKLDQNTFIFFFSDNGAMENWYPTTQYNGKFDANPELGKNAPLRDWKTSNYEGAIRVPAFVYWNDHIPSGVNTNYFSVIDMMPTLTNIAGNEEIPNTVEGKNILESILNDKNGADSKIYVRGHIQESIIMAPWKLIRTRSRTTNPRYELYDLDKDPYETQNVASEYSSVISTLKKELNQQFNSDSKEVNLSLPSE